MGDAIYVTKRLRLVVEVRYSVEKLDKTHNYFTEK